MSIFKSLGDNLTYKDVLQIDGVFSSQHLKYQKSITFKGISNKDLDVGSVKKRLIEYDYISNPLKYLKKFDGTLENCLLDDKKVLWKLYWIEYINAFDQLLSLLPNSIVTTNIGRHAIEIGLKYLLLIKTNKLVKTHKLEELCKSLFSVYHIDEGNHCYMESVDRFCKLYSKYIEGGNHEYFRYPEYNSNKYFAGVCLDIEWLSYNFSLILLKLLHLAGIDMESQDTF